ncbi:GNAT family N-acetyltransferase, partial [Schumannella luteola]
RGTSDDAHIWYRELGATASGLRVAEAWESPAHPDGAYSDDDPGAAALVWRSSATERGALHVEIPEERAPGAPELWFVAVDEPRARPAACNLVAYTGGDIPPGTIITPYAFATLGIPSDAQLGAVRWYRDGLVHQIYVSPDHRRRNIGSTLLYAAGAWQQANRWPGWIHSDGRRTQLGQLFLAAKRHVGRIAPLTETMPAMDPDARQGR